MQNDSRLTVERSEFTRSTLFSFVLNGHGEAAVLRRGFQAQSVATALECTVGALIGVHERSETVLGRAAMDAAWPSCRAGCHWETKRSRSKTKQPRRTPSRGRVAVQAVDDARAAHLRPARVQGVAVGRSPRPTRRVRDTPPSGGRRSPAGRRPRGTLAAAVGTSSSHRDGARSSSRIDTGGGGRQWPARRGGRAVVSLARRV